MGREVRLVPKDWQHPKDYAGRCYKPLLDGARYHEHLKNWKDGYAQWEAGLWRDYQTDEYVPRPADYADDEYWEFEGNPPHADDYMLVNVPVEERTHLMMYETTSEGTPISPAFETPEELARWLADTNASAFGRQGASYEAWLSVCKGGYAPSITYSPQTGLVPGVAYMETAEDS